MFAANEGAVAAPTAGLHFTPALEAALRQRGDRHSPDHAACRGGTFLPVKADDTGDTRCTPNGAAISARLRRRAQPARAPRAAASSPSAPPRCGYWKAPPREDGTIEPFTGETAIFITPGYRFRAVDILLTNFHLPRSTLFMLVSAFSGLETMKHAYAHAIASGYRFYSYGDACLLFRDKSSR